ncbi:MAG: dihydropteroate synthase [Verrucomicrobiota bacterium]|nr:dihydropteroate synthase [Limisphaera sp.]MDW8382229.1 dihydropteroate synthase [Verrucomicrobiota bacterium]
MMASGIGTHGNVGQHSESIGRQAAATGWRAGGHQWRFPGPTLVMGILNVTPDSFADGGLYADPERAVARGLELVAQGADLVDVGGESTRPGAAPVDWREELRRVVPVIRSLARQVRVPLSVDTMKPEVATEALAAGAVIVNDVAANRSDPSMWRLVADARAGYVCMHMQGTPRTMQERPVYRDVVAEVAEFFRDRLQRLQECGVCPDQVVLDVGIGFGKTLTHNLQLLRALAHFQGLGRPLLLGVSRKSFIGALTGASVEARLPGSLACAVWAVTQGVAVLRVHDVAETVQAIRVTEALLRA